MRPELIGAAELRAADFVVTAQLRGAERAQRHQQLVNRPEETLTQPLPDLALGCGGVSDREMGQRRG